MGNQAEWIAFGMPPSQREVLRILKEEKLSQSEIRKRTGFSKRTIKYALKSLLGKKLISSLVIFEDTRRKAYCFGELDD